MDRYQEAWAKMLDEQFSYFSKVINQETLRETFNEATESIWVAIRGNRITSVTKRRMDGWIWRVRGYLALIEDVLKQYEIPDIDIIISTCDMPITGSRPMETYTPVFSFCKSPRDKCILMPFTRFSLDDVPFEGRYTGYWDQWDKWHRWDDAIATMDSISSNFPWEEKDPRCFFIGHTCSWNDSRIKYMNLSLENPQQLLGYITQLHTGGEHLAEGPLKPLLGKWVPMTQYPQYKYLMHLDGNSSSERLRILLGLNSVPIKHESPLSEFYYPLLVPDQHYILVRGDLSDLVPAIDKLEADQKFARYVAEQGQVFVKEALNYDKVLWYVKESFLRYAELQV